MSTMRCQACRRLLTNPASIKHGLGPDCLRRAVKAGTAPLEALAELKEWQRTNKRPAKRKAEPVTTTPCSATLDLFAQARAAAIETLKAAAAECAALGVTVSLSIEKTA